MRVGKILLLGLFVSGMGISTAFAQPADGRAVYEDNAEGFTRADKTTPANISYQTINKTLPYYVAPSTLSHPDLALPRNKVKFTAADLKATWTWTPDVPAILGIAPTDNKADITVNALGTAEVSVVEVSPNCGNGEASKIKIIGTSAPKLEIISAELVTVGGITDAATTGTEVETAAQNLKGYMYKTCDATNVNGKTVKLVLKSTETNLPDADALRKYSFSINCHVYRHATPPAPALPTYTKEVAASSVPFDYTLASKFTVSGAATGTDITVNIPAFAPLNPANHEDYVDIIFFLGGSEGRNGVVSSVSHRSDNPDGGGTITDNPYEKVNDKLFAMIRLTDKPKTGPIYHIPYNY